MAYLDEFRNIFDEIRTELLEKYSSTSLNLWFENIEFVSFSDNTLTMSTDTLIKYNRLRNVFVPILEEKFTTKLGFDLKIDLKFDDSRRSQIPGTQFSQITVPPVTSAPAPAADSYFGPTKPGYNFEYTFDNFVVGNSNRFAHAACTAVAANPGMNYNPLFIYGPSGIGKTHLLYAITNEIKKKKQNVNIIYITSEDFTNQLISAIAVNKTAEFREKYRSCDILLIDDIQFIAGKISTQEEFFHTFNALYEDHKQIILTSDRPPHEMKTLEERLQTRFEWGLVADIQSPDLELRIAIIKKKAEQTNIQIPDDVLIFLAENLRSNIRRIEGAVKKLTALSLIGEEITMDTIKYHMRDLLNDEEPLNVTIDKIFAVTFKKYGIDKATLLGPKRTAEVTMARNVTIYLIRTVTDIALESIGKIFERDHTTIMNSIKRVEKLMLNDSVLTIEIDELKKEIANSKS